MKPFRILGRNIRDAFKSVFRNFSLSIASIACIIVTLILVSVAIILSKNVDSFITDLQSELTIVVYVKKDVGAEGIEAFHNVLEDIDEVEEVIYNNKEEIKEEMISEYDGFEEYMGNWTAETNPLLNRFKVKVKEVNNIKSVAEEIKEFEQYVYSVTYGEKVVDQIIPIFNIIEKSALAMVGALILVTAFLISNTIKLTIFARKNEIEIMRLVGTSNLVIRLPFLFEGLILGVIGSIIPIIISVYGYILLFDHFHGYAFSNIFKLIKPNPFVFQLTMLLLIVGGVVGMIGSYRAVRKYLKI